MFDLIKKLFGIGKKEEVVVETKPATAPKKKRKYTRKKKVTK